MELLQGSTFWNLRWLWCCSYLDLIKSERVVYGDVFRIDLHSEKLNYEQFELILQLYEVEVNIENPIFKITNFIPNKTIDISKILQTMRDLKSWIIRCFDFPKI